MKHQIRKYTFFASLPGILFFSAISVAASNPVFGQESKSGSSEVDGRVIYARDVPYGSAIGPRTPARDHSVNAGPTDLILKTVATGLEPMADNENAGIVAGTNSRFYAMDPHIALGVSVLTEKSGSPSHIGGVQSSAMGKAVGQATGTIQSAMDSMRSALGGGQ